MYLKIIFTSSLFGLFLFFSAYNSGPAFSNNENTTSSEKVIPTKQAAFNSADTCIIKENRGGTFVHRVNANCASDYINAYDTHIENLNNSFTSTDPNLVRGFNIDPIELKEILNDLETGDKLFAMMGIKTDGTTDLVFTVQSVDESTTGQESYKYDYYDFTMPCPNYCPKLYE